MRDPGISDRDRDRQARRDAAQRRRTARALRAYGNSLSGRPQRPTAAESCGGCIGLLLFYATIAVIVTVAVYYTLEVLS